MKKIKLPKENKKKAIIDIMKYFQEERDEEISQLQAQLILDFVIDKIGPHIYNQGISDMQKYLYSKAEEMWEHMI